MCGIVGAIRQSGNAVEFLLNGLKKMEYRGYDSSGMAVLTPSGLQCLRRVGRVHELEKALSEKEMSAHLGMAHTRWATHGAVSEPNAHPQISHHTIAVVHNGIIENYQREKERLQSLGYVFKSQTDTEVIAHVIYEAYQCHQDLFRAVREACRHLEGSYSIGVLSATEPQRLVVAKTGCPLLIGLATDASYFSSDVTALVTYTREVVYLEDGDVAAITSHGVEKIVNFNGKEVKRQIKESQVPLTSLELGSYDHFMQKEIHEQPKAITDTSEGVLLLGFIPELFGEGAGEVLQDVEKVCILACGSSYYAGLAAKYWMEEIAKLPVEVEIASEYRYRDVISHPKNLIVTVSQSGETLDTIEALRRAKSLGHHKTLGICNVMESQLARENALMFYTRAGSEICVASTKAFTTQLIALFVLTVTLGRLKGTVKAAAADYYLESLRHVPGEVQSALNLEPQIKAWATNYFALKQNALFLGRGIHYCVALEGALKLKEITYVHAEAYPAGELKHGPLALVDKQMPVVVIAPNDALLNKLKNNMQEVSARGGELFVFADADTNYEGTDNIHVIRTPRHIGVLSVLVHTIAVQLLAYHTALAKGTDVDKPRNLAKAVTVE